MSDTQGYEEAKKKAESLRVDVEAKKAVEKESVKEAIEASRARVAALYKNDVNAGTEEIDMDDLNIPQLKLVQPNKRIDLSDGTRAEDGYFYRTDTRQQIKNPDVILLVVRKIDQLNYKKEAMERQHVYFGIHETTGDPFRMFCRGWSISGSREFLTEIKSIQKQFNLPMYALKVRLSGVPRSSTTKDNVNYSVFSVGFSILKDQDTGYPMSEDRPEKVEMLRKLVSRFVTFNPSGAEEQDESIRVPIRPIALPEQEEPMVLHGKEETVSTDEIPF